MMIAEMATNATSQGTCAAETPKSSNEMSPQVKWSRLMQIGNKQVSNWWAGIQISVECDL